MFKVKQKNESRLKNGENMGSNKSMQGVKNSNYCFAKLKYLLKL